MDKSKINLITGGSGFLGSHLCRKLLEKGEEVLCLDNFFTGNKRNLKQWIGNPNFELIRHDITKPITLEVDKIWHLACPASQFIINTIQLRQLKQVFLEHIIC